MVNFEEIPSQRAALEFAAQEFGSLLDFCSDSDLCLERAGFSSENTLLTVSFSSSLVFKMSN